MEKTKQTPESRVNGFLNLKAKMIESLRSQGTPEAWIMPTLKATGIYQIQFKNK